MLVYKNLPLLGETEVCTVLWAKFCVAQPESVGREFWKKKTKFVAYSTDQEDKRNKNDVEIMRWHELVLSFNENFMASFCDRSFSVSWKDLFANDRENRRMEAPWNIDQKNCVCQTEKCASIWLQCPPRNYQMTKKTLKNLSL